MKVNLDVLDLDYHRFIELEHPYFVQAIQINHHDGFCLTDSLIEGNCGDYILIGKDRKRHICKKEDFEKYYER